MQKSERIAILIPCYNEALTIARVIKDFHQYVPEAKVFVYDNNSTDETVIVATQEGAVVRREPLQGKGNVVRRMFADIDADIYVLVDGDSTYDVKSVPLLIETLKREQLDMIVGTRKESELNCYRLGHRGGNKVLTKIVEIFFNRKLTDMLSGLRVFSKRYVKTFPAQSKGFEIETELTVYALSRRLPMKEVETDYFARPSGSVSKLSTYRDGIRILQTIILLIKEERPLLFFGIIATIFGILGFMAGIPVVIHFMQTGFVPRLPTAVLASSLLICALISALIGLVLDSLSSVKKEIARQHYLSFSEDFDFSCRHNNSK